MRRSVLALALLTTAAALTFAGRIGISHAQYPLPGGSLEATVDQPVTPVGENRVLGVLLRDRSGAPVVGQTVTFTIVTEPGTDAEVGSKVVSKVTDGAGNATTVLRPGSTPGVVVIRVDAGSSSSTILVNVTGAAATASAPASTPLPPAAPVEIRPPSTGDGGLVVD